MGYSDSEMKNTLLSVGVRQEVVGGIKPKGLEFLVQPRRGLLRNRGFKPNA